jgi:hypothetical protein
MIMILTSMSRLQQESGNLRSADFAMTSTLSEKDAMLAQQLGQLQPFLDRFPPECLGQLGSFGPT